MSGVLLFLKRATVWLLTLPARIASALLEVFISQRGLALAFFAVAAIFVIGPWLRPMLSCDLRATHIPLAIWSDPGVPPVDLLTKTRHIRFDSVGVAMLGVIVWGALHTLFRPRFLGLWAGALMCVAMAATAEVTLNHPELVDLLDNEETQRVQLASVLRHESEQSLAANSPPRTTLLRLPKLDNMPEIAEVEPGDLTRGWFYGMYGPWLVFMAAFTVLVQTHGSWERKLAHLGLWSMLGGAMFFGACSRRLWAEHHWNRAIELERIGDLSGARRSLAESRRILPEMERLDRTWRLAGKLDFRQGWNTPESMYFRIVQHQAHADRAGAVSLVEDLLASHDDVPLIVQHLAGAVYAENAKQYFDQRLMISAQDQYRRALRAAPYRMDCVVALGAISMHTDRFNPQKVEALYDTLAARVGDRLLRADLKTRIGNAYFEASQMDVARKFYEESLVIFAQPKFPNAPAQEGMMGM